MPSRNGVGGVDLGEVVGEPVDQLLAVEAMQVVLGGELAEHSAEVWLDVLR